MAADPSPSAPPFAPADIRALTFDVGGTVFDWHVTTRDAVQELTQAKDAPMDAAQFANEWRRRMLQLVGQVRNGELPWLNADQLHRRALDELLDGSPLAGLSEGERDGLVRSWHRLRVWPDVSPVLERLRGRYTVVVLSIPDGSRVAGAPTGAGADGCRPSVGPARCDAGWAAHRLRAPAR